ncbi:uncharacterized protein [Diabrotica undecimpunctata]|uniref:uncharacterized protein n=1 Tax=Diabrotica undecimpunctata TaxID=50387 RepID=UPI003B641096
MCPVTISWNPYAIFMWDPLSKKYPGVVFLVVNLIAKVMNFTPVYLKSNPNFLAEYFQTGTYKTAEKIVEERHVDLFLYAADNHSFIRLNNLNTLVQDVSFYYLTHSSNHFSINFFFNFFKRRFLIALMIIATIIIILWKVSTRDSFVNSIFNIYRINFQSSITRLTNRMSARMVFSCCLLFAFFVNAKYNSYLSSTFASPGRVKVLGSVNQFQMFKNNKQNEVERFLYFTGYNNSLARTTNNMWLIMDHDTISYRDINKYIENNIPISYIQIQQNTDLKKVEKFEMSTEEQMTGIKYKVASRKGFPFTEIMNYWIEVIHQSGLLKKWKIEQAIPLKKVIVENPSALFIHHLKIVYLLGAFYILNVGYIISALVFIIEVYALKY